MLSSTQDVKLINKRREICSLLWESSFLHFQSWMCCFSQLQCICPMPVSLNVIRVLFATKYESTEKNRYRQASVCDRDIFYHFKSLIIDHWSFRKVTAIKNLRSTIILQLHLLFCRRVDSCLISSWSSTSASFGVFNIRVSVVLNPHF